uniref:Uncharacterized protein n=1 Tax=Avena sativa TaxID=4498 RepID=A0ACD5XUR1_AVESA
MAPKIKRISAKTVGEAVGHILPYLEDTTSSTRYNNIYYDGFPGLGNSAVLKCIAQEPPPTLMKKFGKIVHVDCSRWKSRRELQRTIAQQVQLPQGVMDIFDGKDEEDDFRGLDESSRAEIGDVSREILLSLLDNKCLVVFHNGCNDIVELNDFGIPPAWFGTKVLWTGTGKPWRDPFPYIDSYEKLDASHLYINNSLSNVDEWKCLLQEEAREIARHTCKLGVTSEIAMECCLYLLSMMKHGYSRKMDWDIHASNYLVCDGVIPLPAGCQFDDQAWEVAAALHQYMGIQKAEMGVTRHDALMTSQKRWICSIIHYTTTTMEANVTVPQEATSFLFVKPYLPLATLPNNGMFHQSAIMLRVLRLYGCTFSFSSPPFHCCRGLRFLGLRLCMDQPQGIDEEKDRVQKEVGFFQSLWVVDTRKTDWAPPEITEEMDTNIREIHIKKARFWLHNFPWGQLHNLRKLRVIKPANPLEMHVLPRLPRLNTLILYGCVGLENVTGLPPSLETFSFSVRHDAGRRDAAKITRISMPGCARMVDFTLRGSLPNLKQLNLSGTSIKTLDLSDHVVQAPRLERVILWMS